ncbi:MAG: radical SAM protein [Sphaerochaetaceae bacterium]|jgi:putative pyruvate formate lyase activating enzyme|nr:radical SAM protein [Sphaerochaetaceae bacterium]NLY07125.1 radical SAM protein [Spirochaetales bacterium]
MEELEKTYESCNLCPNHCGVNRLKGELGVCRATSTMRLAWAGLHRGEEPPISGKKGSGMLFFSGCSLHCRYCQNFQISDSAIDSLGVDVSIEQLADLMVDLQDFQAASINMVTASHYIPSVIPAIKLARRNGLKLPIVWNSSGYEDLDALKLIDPYVDTYLIDVKTLDADVAARFCAKADYAEKIIPVMEFLKNNYPRTFIRKQKLYGVIVRHLVFPGTIDATYRFLDWYAAGYKDMSYLSLMVQFVPPHGENGLPPMTRAEYDSLMDRLEELEIDNGFYQEFGEEGGFEKERLWIPDFTQKQPFAPGFADPLPSFLSLAGFDSVPCP